MGTYVIIVMRITSLILIFWIFQNISHTKKYLVEVEGGDQQSPDVSNRLRGKGNAWFDPEPNPEREAARPGKCCVCKHCLGTPRNCKECFSDLYVEHNPNYEENIKEQNRERYEKWSRKSKKKRRSTKKKRRTKKKRPKKLTTTTTATSESKGDGFWRKRSLSDYYDHDIYDDGSDYYDDGSDYDDETSEYEDVEYVPEAEIEETKKYKEE